MVKRDASGAKTEMIWFIGDTQAHYDAAGTVTNVFAHVTVGTPVARVNRTADTTASLELTFHGLANSTLAAVAEDGTVNASFRYAPFGAVLEATDAGGEDAGIDVHKRRFNDKYQDDISGLTYYGARYYDKTLIGWTQADPLYLRVPDAAQMSTPRRANLYAFTLQNPLRYLDPDGLDPTFHSGTSHQGGFRAAMAKQQQGAIYGGGGGTIDTPSKDPMDCGTSAPGVCDPDAAGTYISPPPDVIEVPSPVFSSFSSTTAAPIGQVTGQAAQLCARWCARLKAAMDRASSRVAGAVSSIFRAAPVWRSANIRALGQAGEKAAKILKNTNRIPSATGTAAYRVPDGLNHATKTLSEVKNVGSLSYTNQLRDFASYAASNGYTFELFVRPTTELSGPLQQAVANGQIVLRFLP